MEATLQASMCHQFMPLSLGFQIKMLLKYFGCNSCLFPYSSAEYLRRQYRHAMICHSLVFQIHANAIFFLSFESTHESTTIHFLMKQNFTLDISKEGNVKSFYGVFSSRQPYFWSIKKTTTITKPKNPVYL